MNTKDLVWLWRVDPRGTSDEPRLTSAHGSGRGLHLVFEADAVTPLTVQFVPGTLSATQRPGMTPSLASALLQLEEAIEGVAPV